MWIVQLQYRALLENAGRAETRRMIRIALDFRRSTLVALDDEAGRVAIDRHRRGVMQRVAWNDIGRSVDVRQDLPIGCAHASAKACQRGAGPEQRDEVATRKRIWRCGDALGEFAEIVSRHVALPMAGRAVCQRSHMITRNERVA
jgi:hypothetical protein